MSKVFISYRREDAAGYAQAIYGQLERHLQRDHIFMDVDTVEPGVDFVTRIQQAVSECDVVIALIGNRWMGERENASPRIQDPQDFVHLEIATALSRNIRVIPVLVDGANMPSAEQLPLSLQPLVRRHALELSNTRFRFDLERVSQAVQKSLIRRTESPGLKWRWRSSMWHWAPSVLVIMLGIAVALWFTYEGSNQTMTKTVNQVSNAQADRKKLEELRREQEALQRTRADLQRQYAEAKRQLEIGQRELEERLEFRSKQGKSSKELDDEIKTLENNLKQLKENAATLAKLNQRI
jgi:hypothetical protein